MCPFVPRCNYAREKCEQKRPDLLQVTPGHFSACWFWEEVSKESDETLAAALSAKSATPASDSSNLSAEAAPAPDTERKS
jgi:hypothetical protein